MANPQAENGHTDIANEIIDRFCQLQLSGYQWRILFVILRQTYGWHKKIDRISLSTFEEKTGIPQKHLIPSLKELVERKIIIKYPETYITGYGLQKDYELWKSPLKSGISKTTPQIGSPENGSPDTGRKALPKSGVKPLQKSGDTKEIKENIQKKDALRASFEVFYKGYPIHKARKNAFRAWEKLNPSSELQQTILSSLERQKNTNDWKKDGGKYIPHPATWLNGRRWEDEVPEVKGSW